MPHYSFFQNDKCEFFPCHHVENSENFNCLFCYCPLYALGSGCGGNFSYTESGIKDCSGCIVPHRPENYDYICKKMSDIISMVQRQTGETEST